MYNLYELEDGGFVEGKVEGLRLVVNEGSQLDGLSLGLNSRTKQRASRWKGMRPYAVVLTTRREKHCHQTKFAYGERRDAA